MRDALARLDTAASRAICQAPAVRPQSIDCELDRIVARCARTVAGPNRSSIVNATTSRRSKSWKRCFGDSADTLALETEQLLPPPRQQLLQAFSSGGRYRERAEGVRRVDRRRRI